MKRPALPACALLLSLVCAGSALARDKDKVDHINFQFNGHQRTYSVMIPSAAAPTAPLAAVVLLHAQGGWASDVMSLWHSYASHAGFIVIAPESLSNTLWDSKVDGPDFLHAVVSDVNTKHPIDPHRVYLFGETSGGVYALAVGLFDAQSWGGTCVHAAVLDPSNYGLFQHAAWKEPFQEWVGDNDADAPIHMMTNERDAFKAAGFPFDLRVIPNSDAAYGNVYDEVNEACWKFFQQHQIPDNVVTPFAAAPATPAPAAPSK